jgi:hypothetical protein
MKPIISQLAITLQTTLAGAIANNLPDLRIPVNVNTDSGSL